MSAQTLVPSPQVFDRGSVWTVPAVRIGAPAPAVAVTQSTAMISPDARPIHFSAVPGCAMPVVTLKRAH